MSGNDCLDLTLLFADIAGSTALYERLGDEEAHKQVTRCLQEVSSIVEENTGVVVEIIGDEILAYFKSADDAFEAACSIQEELDSQKMLAMRVGFHTGPTAMEDGRPFGDIVNVASRMVNLSKRNQIILSEDSHRALSPLNQESTRHLNHIPIKGKAELFNIYEGLWEQNDHTALFGRPITKAEPIPEKTFLLKCHGQVADLDAKKHQYTLGRSELCDLKVPSKSASRFHAQMEYRMGKVILKDESTNGTYVRTLNGEELFLHHEELTILDDSKVSLGAPIGESEGHLIYLIAVEG